MKKLSSCMQKFLLIIVILFFHNLNSLNIPKLVLKEITLQDTTLTDQEVVITFHKKCPSCPRLHTSYDRTVKIPAGQKLTIQDKPHIIKSIIAKNQNAFVNLSSYESHIPEVIEAKGEELDLSQPTEAEKNARTPAAIFTLDSFKKEDFPRHVTFEETFKNNDEYEMLMNGHEDCKNCMPENVIPQVFFNKLKQVYEKHNLSKMLPRLKEKNIKRRIPRIIHTIWFEGSQNGYPMYSQFKTWQQEWKDKHPDFVFICWDEKRIKEKFSEGLYNQKIYDEACMMYDYASMSKIVRYEILNKFGGLYIDPDIKCFESFAPLHQVYDFYAGLGTFESFGAVNNSVIGSKAKHPILQAVIEQIKKTDGPLPYDTLDLYNWTARNQSTQILTKTVFEKLDDQENVNVIFPRTFFDGNEVEKEFYHMEKIYEASYEHIAHRPEAFCARGIYSYVTNKNLP